MKTYSCRTFKNINDLLNWLNNGQDYINVVSIMYLNSFEVIYYTGHNTSGGHRGMG